VHCSEAFGDDEPTGQSVQNPAFAGLPPSKGYRDIWNSRFNLVEPKTYANVPAPQLIQLNPLEGPEACPAAHGRHVLAPVTPAMDVVPVAHCVHEAELLLLQ